MACKIDGIPEKTRWEVLEAFNVPLWYQAGKGAKDFAGSVGMPAQNAPEIEEVTHLMAKVVMGLEFASQIVESTNDRCVGRANECPWHKMAKGRGLDFDPCGAGHQNWGDGAVESLNPDFSFKLVKNMNCGDEYCEWVVERKKEVKATGNDCLAKAS
jgi:hypothetical protein